MLGAAKDFKVIIEVEKIREVACKQILHFNISYEV